MKRAIAISCLLLMTVVPVAAWATTCCPPDHDMDMRAADDCLVPATQTSSASVVSRSFGESSLRHLVSAALAIAARHDIIAESRPAESTSRGDASPGVAQTSPVLLR
ncbi:MAG: hypothetical protein PVJ49_09300 [Acidobacteriota bacterium]|jgi:hypothetical protein